MAPMHKRLIILTGSVALMGLFAALGFRSDRLVPRTLQGVGQISLPASVAPRGSGEALTDDSQRVYFQFAREYGWLKSLGSSMAYRQLLTVSVLAHDEDAADYESWPPGFRPLYSTLQHERTLPLGDASVKVSAGRYAQNSLDEPAHLYFYADPSRRLHIAWHVVDKDVAPEAAVPLLQRIAESFRVDSGVPGASQ